MMLAKLMAAEMRFLASNLHGFGVVPVLQLQQPTCAIGIRLDPPFY